MTNKKIDNKGCITSYTNCIKYDGIDIPCLGIKKGDYINQIMCILVDKICEISQPQDLSSLSIQCLIDKFINIQEPLSKNIVSYLQLLVNNQCTLKDLIDAINLRIDGITIKNLILDLKCLALPDNQGNVNYTEQSVLQTLINETCSHKLHLTTIDGQILILENQINNLINNGYTEPLLNSCLYTNKKTSQAVTILANNYCNYKIKVGSDTDIDSAISRQCDGLNNQFKFDNNFIQNPASLANSENNQWIVLCDQQKRLTALEACACKVKCSDIKLAWQINDSEDGTSVTIEFGTQYGNNIPSPFIDCGSTITFIDVDKKKKEFVIVVKESGISPEYDLSFLNLSKPVVVKICAKLCNGTEQCCKCEETEHLVTNGSCNVCDVTITGTSGKVTITYVHNGNTTTISAVVGEVVYLPKDAINVSYVTESGDAVPDTSCLALVETTKKCLLIAWEATNPDISATSGIGDAVFSKIKFADNSILNISGPTYGQINTQQSLYDAINIAADPRIKAKCHQQSITSAPTRFVKVEVRSDLSPIDVILTNPTAWGNMEMGVHSIEEPAPCDCTGFSTSSII